MKFKPNFLVIGAPKCGTTSLYYYLKQHPDIFLPVQKELHYFSYKSLSQNSNGPGDEVVLRGLCASQNEYYKHYDEVKLEKAIGDISPSYLYYGMHEEIKKELGAVKIVVMLRNPIDKAFSQYMHMVRDQREILPFFDALMEETKRADMNWSDIWRYAESSLYSNKLKSFIRCFGRQNVHIVIFDDLISDPRGVTFDVLEFLGLETSVEINTDKSYNRTGNSRSRRLARFLNRPSRVKNIMKHLVPDALRIAIRLKIIDINTSSKPEIDEDSRKYLNEYFSSDIIEFERLIGRKTGWSRPFAKKR